MNTNAPSGVPPARDADTGVAQYVQLASVLRHRIAHGELAPGERLPTVAELADSHGLARITVRQAYGLLAREGLVTSTRGRGTFVADHPPALDGRLRHAINDPQTTDLRLDILEQTSGHPLPAALAGGAPTWPSYTFVRKIHHHDGTPFCRVDLHVADELAARFPPGSMARHKIGWLLGRHAAETMHSVQQTLTVAPADLVLARDLGCAFATPVVHMTRRVLDAQGHVALAGHFWYRGDRFVMDLQIPFDIWVNYPGVVMPDSRRPADPDDGGP